jgi:hypothetical protein
VPHLCRQRVRATTFWPHSPVSSCHPYSAGVVKVIDLYDASGMSMDEFADMLRAGRRNDVWVVYEHAYSGDLTARERKLPVIGGNQMHRLELL